MRRHMILVHTVFEMSDDDVRTHFTNNIAYPVAHILIIGELSVRNIENDRFTAQHFGKSSRFPYLLLAILRHILSGRNAPFPRR
ncbi:hypothetical protein D3C76_1551750 [compost metagenome]